MLRGILHSPWSAAWVLTTCLWLPSPTWAATAYIIDEIRVSLRDSPCESCAVVERGMPSGTRLEVVESRDGWSRVRTAAGKEGWVLSRYLTNTPIARDQLDTLRLELEQLREENQSLRERLAEPAGHEGAPESSTNPPRPGLYHMPPADSAELHAQNEELLKRNRILQSEAEVLLARLEQAENNERQLWFFYGGVLVVLGTILSALVPRLKPLRRGYSEWR